MKRTKHFSELVDLAEQVINGEASDSSLERLNALLHDNVDAQRFYLDYMQLHTALKTESNPSVEVVRRRAVFDEVVVRPLHSTNEQHHFENTEKNKFDLQQRGSNLTTNSFCYLLAGALFLLCMLVGGWLFNSVSTSELVIAKVLKGELVTEDSSRESFNYLTPGSYKSRSPLKIELDSGVVLSFDADSSFKVFNAREIKLTQGSIEVHPSTNVNLQIHSDAFEINTFGGSLVLDLIENNAFIKASKEVRLSPSIWKPRHLWTFDERGASAFDSAGSATGALGKGITRVDGIVGKGALHFDNSSHARVDVGSGGGIAPATGTFL